MNYSNVEEEEQVTRLKNLLRQGNRMKPFRWLFPHSSKDFYVELIKVKERLNLEQRKLMLKEAKCLPIFRLAWEVSCIMKQSRFIMLFVELSILIFSNLIFPRFSVNQNCFAEALLDEAKHINIEHDCVFCKGLLLS